MNSTDCLRWRCYAHESRRDLSPRLVAADRVGRCGLVALGVADAVVTRAERRVLAAMADGAWHSEAELRASFRLLQGLWLRGLVEGIMQTTGATRGDRLWRAKLDPRLD